MQRRVLLLMQCILSPWIIILFELDITFAIPLVFSILLASVMWMASATHLRSLNLHLASIGFLSAIGWIYVVANQIVAVLQAIVCLKYARLLLGNHFES